MAAITSSLAAQIDLHSHAVTEGYLTFVKEHHAEMDEGFPLPGWGADGIKLATEVGRTSMATEPGVLTLFSMQDKANPAKIYILEIYADATAYQRHIQTPQFKKYKEGTAKMVRSLRLIDVDPLVETRLKQH